MRRRPLRVVHFLSDEAAAGAGVAVAVVAAPSLLGFESLLESLLGLESVPALPVPSPEDFGLALP